MSDPMPSAALTATRRAAVRQPAFPTSRVARRLGIEQSAAAAVLQDEERSRRALEEACQEFLEADDARRAGARPAGRLADDPDFPTGTGMALVGAAMLWEHRDLVPAVALRVAKDRYEAGEDELAASYIALVQESVDPGSDDLSAWTAQSLLLALMQRSGTPGAAEEIARDLVAHDVPLELWKDDDPRLPDDSMAWHGGAFVGGIPPRRDERSLSIEDVQDYLGTLLAQTRREMEAEAEPPHPEHPTGKDGTGRTLGS